MNGRFYLLGAIISLVLHGALFSLLAIGPCRAKPSEKAMPADDVPVVAETNAEPTVVAPVAATPVPKPSRRVTDPFAEDVAPVSSLPTTVARPAEPVRMRATTPPPATPEPAEKEREWRSYVVKKGDTLTILSRKAGCSVAEIAKKNKKTVAQMAKLWVGQKIWLPAE